ncbi:tetratricopeptide (TPR) repeat protein [Anoxybacillus mongoliensis]|uniref:Tetratricopeptide (TPR) repeat protein n=1 Tax=Anoxybacillus mongoliensis TaxID=452565 RepID=A0A7W8JDK5_9BACL|nr:tetratricopeptide (TPR) repeat protein [Anoxybacillus mongoliensis]
MKNRKIVPHPYLKERLLAEGMDALKGKRYKEAYTYFVQLEQLQLHDDDVEMALVVCLFEMGQAEEAKERCEQLLERGKGDWAIYISMLVHLQQYDEVVAVIHKLQRKGIDCTPFLPLLQFSEKMIRSHDDHLTKQYESIFQGNEWTKQLRILQQLDLRLVSHLAPIFVRYLRDETKHPIVKTTMLHILKREQVTEPMTVKKFGQTMTVVPAGIDEQKQKQWTKQVLDIVEQTWSKQNPTMYEWCEQIWLRYMFVMYPFLPTESAQQWANALYTYVEQCETGQTIWTNPLVSKLYEAEKLWLSVESI